MHGMAFCLWLKGSFQGGIHHEASNYTNTHGILTTPSTMPLEEKGMAWDHPAATVTGVGELKFEDEGANIPLDVSYKGTITCNVSASAAAILKNKVEIDTADVGRDVEAASKSASISIDSCTVTDANGVITSVSDTAAMTASKVEVEIEGFYENAAGELVFSEYEAEGTFKNGVETKAKLVLKNGTVMISPPPPLPCTVPPCGGGGGTVGTF